jgi:hypothetical protein
MKKLSTLLIASLVVMGAAWRDLKWWFSGE